MTRLRLLSLVAVLLVIATLVPISVAIVPDNPRIDGGSTYDVATNTTTVPTPSNESRIVSAEFSRPERPNPSISSDVAVAIRNASDPSGGPATQDDERIELVVHPRPGATDAAATLADQLGTVQTRHDSRLLVELPTSAVTRFANDDAVTFVRRPYRLQTFDGITSQGVETVNATELHRRGYTGEDVTVAVIDGAFNVENGEIADNVVATESFNGGRDAFRTADTHGTAVSEVVVDTAPNVSLVLISVGGSSISMENALEYVAGNDSIDALSMSVGFTGGMPLDGSDSISQSVDGIVESGKPVFVSAGNEANGNHWHGTWADGDGDRLLNFPSGGELMPIEGDNIDLIFQWRDWPTSDQDYDIYLFDSDGRIVAASNTVQDGRQPPIEVLSYRGTPGESYYLAVVRESADGNAEFDAFIRGRSTFRYGTEARSLIVPATSEDGTAVAAVNYATRQVEPFSSRGPTVDGRQKPELSAPDGVRTSTLSPFYGTSAAAPHAAGVGTLLLDANPTLSADGVESTLRESARPALGTEPNTVTGAGIVDARAAFGQLDRVRTDRCLDVGGEKTVVLEDTLTSSGNRCFAVSGSDVTIDGNDHAIDGSGSGTGVAVSASRPVTNVTIRDLTVSDVRTGISVGPNVSGVTLRDVTVARSTTGFDIDADDTTMTNVSVRRSDSGIEVDADGTTASAISFRAVEDGILAADAASGNSFSDVSAGSVSRWAYRAEDGAGVNYVEDMSITNGGAITYRGTAVAIGDGQSVPRSELPDNRTILQPAVNVTGTNDDAWIRLNISYNTRTLSPGSPVTMWDYDGSNWRELTDAVFDTSDGQPYVSTNGSATASTIAVLAEENATTSTPVVVVDPVTDPDGDGVYEDVNGDGSYTVTDVQALFANRDSAAIRNDPDAFDFNGDGEFSINDVQALFARL